MLRIGPTQDVKWEIKRMDKTDWKSLLNETCFIDDTVHKVLVTGCSQLPDLSGKSTTDGFVVSQSCTTLPITKETDVGRSKVRPVQSEEGKD